MATNNAQTAKGGLDSSTGSHAVAASLIASGMYMIVPTPSYAESLKYNDHLRKSENNKPKASADSLKYNDYLSKIENNEPKTYKESDALFKKMNVKTMSIASGPAMPLQPITVSTEEGISDKVYTNRAVGLNKGITSISTPMNSFSLSRTTLGEAYTTFSRI